MEKNLFEGVELQFNDLSEEIQEKLYFSDKEKFKKEAARSKYEHIRRFIISDNESDVEILDEVFKVETQVYGNLHHLRKLWNNPKFNKNDEKRQILAESDCAQIQLIAAEDEGTSSVILNQILRKEVVKINSVEEVIEAIFENDNFEMEEETRRVLAKSDNYYYRCIAAEHESNSCTLTQMLQDEIQGHDDRDVINAILNNQNFKMNDETRKILTKSDDWRHRQIAAKDEGSSCEFLNKMLQDEVQGPDDSDVVEAILNNPNFKMEDETRKVLAKSSDEDYRKMIAEDDASSEELLEDMYLRETDEDVFKAIELNFLRKISKSSVTLNAIQKRQILGVLKDVKRSSNFSRLSKYMKQILDIIG